MRSFFLCLIAFLLLISFPACSPSAQRNPFAYANGAFSVSVRGSYTPAGEDTPRSFAAEITAGAPAEDDPTHRDLTVTFTSPESLAGVTVSAVHRDGTRTVTFSYPSDYGRIQVTAKSTELDGFLRFAEALLPVGDVAEVSPKAADGSYTVTRRSPDRETVFTFSEDRDVPLRVTVTTPAESLSLTVTPNENGIPSP